MYRVKSRRQEYSETTRQALLDSATELIAERGYTRTSLDQVAAHARVTKGALYGHFANKEALFRAVLEQLEAGMAAGLRATMSTVRDPWERAVVGLRGFLDACCDPVYGRVVMREGPIALSYSAWKEAEELHSYALTRDQLHGLIRAGLVDPVPLEPAARVLHGMLGTAAVTIAEAAPADQRQVRSDMETVLLRVLVGLRRST